MDNTLLRSVPCGECGEPMLWTQNAWRTGEGGTAAYQCLNAHVLDPGLTRQCPKCGVHDTSVTGTEDGRQQFKCLRCGEAFRYPR
jgi:endogenous inhibitor of DNA gyrase (YacG/DUF329 family)